MTHYYTKEWTTVIILFIAVLISCNNNNTETKKLPVSKESQEDSLVRIAKISADSVFYYVNIAVNEMTRTKSHAKKNAIGKMMDQHCKPFQKTIDSIKEVLPNRKGEIDSYRQSLLNKVQNGSY